MLALMDLAEQFHSYILWPHASNSQDITTNYVLNNTRDVTRSELMIIGWLQWVNLLCCNATADSPGAQDPSEKKPYARIWRHNGGGSWCSRLVCTQTWVSLPVAWLSSLRASDNTLRALCKEDLHTAANNSDASCVSCQEVRCHRPSRWIRAKAGLGSKVKH